MHNIEIVRKPRRTLCLQIKRDGTILLLAPLGASGSQITEFIEKHKSWLDKHYKSVMEKRERFDRLDDDDIVRLRKSAKEFIPNRAEYYANLMGVRFEGIRITSAKTRFGSCSAKNSLSFSLYLMTYPERAVDYVIVHELAHVRHKNHSPAFYREIERILPDYKERVKLLKDGVL